jgi:2,4-dienoyl-CoA reductase-like NADH-dependent reductase (Old Yellow Enzyme family)
VRVIERGGAVPGMQISHAGRKASSQSPWEGGGPTSVRDGGWLPWGASALAFSDAATVPHVMTAGDIQTVLGEFRDTARRAREAGMKVLEVHGAHGYLIHSFLSPLSNTRSDLYGGDMPSRARLLLEVVDAIREEWPEELPLFVRLSCVDWMAGGLTLEDTILIAQMLKATGKVDLIDCSTGGLLASGPVIPSLHPGYQVPFAEAVRREAGIATGAVGLITTPEHAEEILGNGRADMVFVARAILADPIWPLRAALALGAPLDMPVQYQRSGFGKR